MPLWRGTAGDDERPMLNMRAFTDWFGQQPRALRAAALFLLAGALFGLFVRLLPLFQGADTLAQRFITEDGYLMLTVARNMATGLGMTVSEGTIATNGIQPLATFLYTIPYILTGGSKIGGIAGVSLIMIGFAVAGGILAYRFARQALAVQADHPLWAAAVAVWWFVGALPMAHTMNALETGLYVAVVLLTVLVFGGITARGGAYTRRDQLLLGSLCGICFLARIDGALLVTALFGVRFLSVQASGQLGFRQAVAEALPPGFLSLAFAAPWLVHNQLRFGSIMPISGPAQSINAEFASNLPFIPAKLLEHLLVIVPVPNEIETEAVVALPSLAIVAGVLGLFLWRQFADRSPVRYAVLGYTVYGGLLVGYYGLFFGAAHFLPRYTFPLSPLLITAGVGSALFLARKAGGLGRGMVAAGLGAAILASVGYTALRHVARPPVQGHFQVVGWVRQNVDEEVWVGAVQTGTLGYWHDRTINLDGKVNPEALEARISRGHVLDYVLASRIDVLADWAPIADWPLEGQPPAFAEVFEPVVTDRERNLGVQVRKGATLRQADRER